jgi:sodium-coupled neutral amino acid transporter 11
MVSLGALSGYTFGLYGRLLNSHPAKSLGELWEKINGRSSSWVISLATLTFCFGGALSYSILLGDTFSALAQTAGLQGLLMARSVWILLVTSTILYPLCNLKSLLALAPLSISGVAAVAATTCFLGWRCPFINSNSPYAEGTGALISSLSPRLVPKFNTYNKGILSLSSTVLVGMAASAYLGHFSAPSFFDSLRQKDKSRKAGSSSKDLQSFNIMTSLGFGLATLLNCLVMSFGFLTFGGSSTGVILNNFSTLDAGASICRLLMAVCVIGGYPFLVRAVTSEGLALLGKPMDDSVEARKRETVATSITLLLLTLASLVMKDAGFVIGFSGAVMGSFIVYIFPALLFLSNSRGGVNLSLTQKLERTFCRGLTVFGAVVALLGGGVSVANSYFPHLLQ